MANPPEPTAESHRGTNSPVLSSEPVPDSMANLHQAITPRGTVPNTAAELNTSTLGTRASHNPLRSTRPRANTRRAASICEAASNISSYELVRRARSRKMNISRQQPKQTKQRHYYSQCPIWKKFVKEGYSQIGRGRRSRVRG